VPRPLVTCSAMIGSSMWNGFLNRFAAAVQVVSRIAGIQRSLHRHHSAADIRITGDERKATVLARHTMAILRETCVTTSQDNQACDLFFRHTFGTLLNANGENPKVVQELLRHASLKVTTDIYMQAVGPQKREAQSNLVRLVRKGFDSEAKSS